MAAERLYGVLAEFDSPGALLEAARALRAQGYRNMDACTPFPVHGIDEALGLRGSPLGWIALAAGLTGAALALALQWWTGAIDYPLIVGGKPFFAFEPSIPITFELTVLLAALATVFGMLALNRLPRLYHPLFECDAFRGATDDRFLLAIEATDSNFHAEETRALLERLGAVATTLVEEAQ